MSINMLHHIQEFLRLSFFPKYPPKLHPGGIGMEIKNIVQNKMGKFSQPQVVKVKSQGDL